MPNYTLGSTRVSLQQPDLTTFQNNGSVVLDSRRTRPLWFDGRFMAARDLEREQDYFLQREADLGQASGFEGISGLMVDQLQSTDPNADTGTIVIHAGHGVTPAGEWVNVPNDVTIQLSQLSEQSSLDVQFGISVLPPPPAQSRTGLYVIALQPVEFTANPITAYPTTVQGPRTTHDGDIVQATAVSLVPYPNPPANYAASMQRSALARQIFLTGNPAALSDALLPLAVVSLNGGAIQWIDPYLVRRDTGPQYSGVRFGLTDPATQQAFLMQYDMQLQTVVASRQSSGLKANFAATDYFTAIPPAGRISLDAIDTNSFSQVFFPQAMDVRLSIKPADEMADLLQEGMSLPPFDLTLSPSAYSNMAVFVLIPVPRDSFGSLESSLPDIPLNPTLPQVLANRSPIELLRLYQGSTGIVSVPPVSNNAWASAIGSQKYAFYLRRRSDPTMVQFKTPVGITLASSKNPSMEGQTVTFTATLSPSSAAGNVQFFSNQASLGVGTLSGGVATVTAPFAAVGTYTITATYNGDANNTSGASAPLTQTVVKAMSSVTLASSANPSTFGQAVTFTATVTPNSATGTMTFTGMGTAPVAGGLAKLTMPSLAAGTYTVTATYSGDAETAGSVSAPLTQTVNKAASSATLASSVNPATPGQSVVFTATVSPSAATGNVTFLRSTTALGSGTLNSGAATLTTSFPTAGTFSITAAYGGDNNNLPSTSAPLTETVNKLAANVTLSSSTNPSSQGQAVTFTAKVSPASASGSVQFLDGTTALGNVTLSGGAAALTVSTLAVGAHTITAAYGGDNNDAASTSAPLTQTVNKAGSTVAVTSSANPSTQGQTVTFTAKVSPASATGTVQFLDGTASLGTGTISSGVATLAVSTLTVGTHTITATYDGDANNNASTSAPLTQTVNKATSSVTLNSSANPSTQGQSVTFTATLSPASATGSVQFLDGTTSLGTGTISAGAATLAVSTLAVGTHTITAAYAGDANNASSTSAVLNQTVNKVGTTLGLSSSVNPSNPGQAVIFTATVAPRTATGTVTFTDGTTSLGTGAVSSLGLATLSVSPLAAGAHTITASYGGDANNAASTSSPLIQTVRAGSSVALASSANPSNPGQAVTFTATVTPKTATGTVTFNDGATSLGTGTLSGGIATFSVSTLTSGAHTITAAYSGDANNVAGTSSPLTQTVKTASSVALASSVNPSNPGQAVTFTATVTPKSATGTVTFNDGTTSVGTGTLDGGVATLSVSTLAAGAHTVTAAYGGDGNNVASTSSPLTQTVKAASSVGLTSSVNPSSQKQAVIFTATVTPNTATGTVTFNDGTTSVGTGTLSGGVATLSLDTLQAGAHTITAAYGGDANTVASTSSPLTQTVRTISSVGLASSANPSNQGQAVTFTATMTPKTATGTVTFNDGTTSLGTGALNGGVATFSVSTLAVGAHTITAAYGGDANTVASTSPPLTQTVRTASSVALASSVNPSDPGQAVTFTATVTPKTATGTVTFNNGTASLGTGTLNGGVATLSVSTLAAGAHTIAASYAGDGTNAPSNSAPLTQTVKAASTVAVSSSANPGTEGQPVTFKATVSPASATGSVQFKDGTTSLGASAVSGGAATLATSNLAVGAHSITAVYGGDAKTAASTSAVFTETIDAVIE